MHWGWAYDGVNQSVPRNTGPECAEYLSPLRQLLETIVVVPICSYLIYISLKRVKPIQCDNYNNNNVLNINSNIRGSKATTNNNSKIQSNNIVMNNCNNVNNRSHRHNNLNNLNINKTISYNQNNHDVGKQILLVAMTFILGLELGFKFSTRTVIYALNPCHITTLMQIYCLAAKPSKTITIIFRIQMNYMNGPILAFVFPETDSRQIPVEAATYWIQHALMCIIPLYLLWKGGVYTMEDLGDFSWNIISYALLLIYHYMVLQILAIPSQTNLNHMLCPAILDPFEGPFYRIGACFHQAILCPLLCKIFCVIAVRRNSTNNYDKNNVNSIQPLAVDDNELVNQNNYNDELIITKNGNKLLMQSQNEAMPSAAAKYEDCLHDSAQDEDDKVSLISSTSESTATSSSTTTTTSDEIVNRKVSGGTRHDYEHHANNVEKANEAAPRGDTKSINKINKID